MQSPAASSLRRGGRILWLVLEFAIVGALVLVTRCANYRDVFVQGQVYFADADCYSRMTRARQVAQHPGVIVRQHDFENFPSGVDAHTTAPLDYLLVALATLLQPFTAQPLDLAGAFLSPLLALAVGWFLCWWTRRMRLRFRWGALLFFVLSPILVHGTELGRPDHQSLLIVLVLVALAAEWSWQEEHSTAWSLVSGLSWGFALWVSLYEPVLLFAVVLLARFQRERGRIFRGRGAGWIGLGAVVLLAAVVERRWPQLPEPGLRPALAHWATTIGELQPLRLTNPLWWQWFGGFLLLLLVLLVFAFRPRRLLLPLVYLLGFCFLLTIWQARWGYFLALVVCLSIPALLTLVRQTWLGVLLLIAAFFPILQAWDATLWPNDMIASRRAEMRREVVEWRSAARALSSLPSGAFLAPWWLSPEVAYWSGMPGVAGSSHESLPGIIASARFYASTHPEEARGILREHRVRWLLVYDADRVAQNTETILSHPVPANALCRILDRAPARAPAFLHLRAENGSCKIYEVQK